MMTKYNQRKLSDGRLSNSAVGSYDSRLGAGRNQSNYLVSNDGVQTMDLPRNFVGPRSPESSNRKTPVLIPPIKYIVYNNPQAAYDFLVSQGLNVEPNIPSTLQFAMSYIKQRGDAGILEFVDAAHPDKEVILKAINQLKDSSFSEKPETTPEKPLVAKETTTDTETKTESKLDSLIKANSKTIIIILVIVVFYLMVKK